MEYIQKIKDDLAQYIDQEKAEFLPNFFNAFPGGYGEGDQFLGVRVPDQRKVAGKYYRDISLEGVQLLLRSPVHEYRLTALVILVHKFEKAKDEADKKAIVDLYISNLEYVNNWDLVDSSADKILGAYLAERDRSILYRLARTNHLWSQRIAIMATFYFIRRNEFQDTLEIAKILLKHEHDLIHKAVGWMLREVGKRDFRVEYEFLKKYYKEMPRTMLRYAIEKFEPELRQQFLKGLI
ncbi:MAG: DNA alkylation repair protein [Halanaerobiaceae bacterium]|nr:DNA alkylation repair protein [Halanaerobiaceae bacterium]